MLQALGSKAEVRAKRRKKKKDSYAQYLESPTWRAIRKKALRRDKHKCRACSGKAQVVHHIRYPKTLGQERMEWLYSLCAPCHDEIHRRATKGTTLRHATEQVLGLPPQKRARKKKQKQPEKPKLLIRTGSFIGSKPEKKRKRKETLIEENERLRETFRLNRERRDRRWDHG